MSTRRLREDEHRTRAQRHRAVGSAIAEAGDEWAAVPMFYSCYHLVKAALLRDPIWGQVADLHAIHPDLIAGDQHTSRHKGRRRAGGPKEWGINELVQLLYPAAARAYEQLHQASISVRYGTGLPAGALAGVIAAIECIEDLDSRGELEAPIPVIDP